MVREVTREVPVRVLETLREAILSGIDVKVTYCDDSEKMRFEADVERYSALCRAKTRINDILNGDYSFEELVER